MCVHCWNEAAALWQVHQFFNIHVKIDKCQPCVEMAMHTFFCRMRGSLKWANKSTVLPYMGSYYNKARCQNDTSSFSEHLEKQYLTRQAALPLCTVESLFLFISTSSNKSIKCLVWALDKNHPEKKTTKYLLQKSPTSQTECGSLLDQWMAYLPVSFLSNHPVLMFIHLFYSAFLRAEKVDTSFFLLE